MFGAMEDIDKAERVNGHQMREVTVRVGQGYVWRYKEASVCSKA